MRGQYPPETARHALERAAMLAPFDTSLMMETVLMLAAEGKIELAKYFVGPLASDPHDGGLARKAQFLEDALQSATETETFITDWSEFVAEVEAGAQAANE